MCWVKNVQWKLASKEYKNNITEKSAKKHYVAKKPYANGEQVLKDFQHYCNSFLSPIMSQSSFVNPSVSTLTRKYYTEKVQNMWMTEEPCLFFSVITQVTSSYLPWNSYDTRRKCGCGSRLSLTCQGMVTVLQVIRLPVVGQTNCASSVASSCLWFALHFSYAKSDGDWMWMATKHFSYNSMGQFPVPIIHY